MLQFRSSSSLFCYLLLCVAHQKLIALSLIRNLPCSNHTTGEIGICTFNWYCINVAYGVYIGNCLDRFFVGTCCKIPEKNALNETSSLRNSVKKSTEENAEMVSPTAPHHILETADTKQQAQPIAVEDTNHSTVAFNPLIISNHQHSPKLNATSKFQTSASKGYFDYSFIPTNRKPVLLQTPSHTIFSETPNLNHSYNHTPPYYFRNSTIPFVTSADSSILEERTTILKLFPPDNTNLNHDQRKPVSTHETFNQRTPITIQLEHNMRKPVVNNIDHDGRKPVINNIDHDGRKPVILNVQHNLRKPVPFNDEHDQRWPVLNDESHNEWMPTESENNWNASFSSTESTTVENTNAYESQLSSTEGLFTKINSLNTIESTNFIPQKESLNLWNIIYNAIYSDSKKDHIYDTSTSNVLQSSTTSSVKLHHQWTNPSLSSTLGPESTDISTICGRPSSTTMGRIVGGRRSHSLRWPWMISLQHSEGKTLKHKCGATLLNQFWAATAAHCVDGKLPRELTLRFGEQNFLRSEYFNQRVDRGVDVIIIHPDFNPSTYENDLALLRFEVPVQYQPNIVPVCLPSLVGNITGRIAVVTGWGKLAEEGELPASLHEVYVPIISNEDCEKMYTESGYTEAIKDVFVCAGVPHGGLDACEGDSGGPMVIRAKEGQWILVGLISWGISCAAPKQPGVYTRISQFKNWINDIIYQSDTFNNNYFLMT